MKTITSLLLGALIACGGGAKTGPATNSAKPSPGDGTPCTQEIALVCPDGQIDACDKALADPSVKPTPTDPDEPGSGTAMALDEGRMATLEKAGNHRCVPK